MVEKYRKAGLLSDFFFFKIKPLVRLFNKKSILKTQQKEQKQYFSGVNEFSFLWLNHEPYVKTLNGNK